MFRVLNLVIWILSDMVGFFLIGQLWTICPQQKLLGQWNFVKDEFFVSWQSFSLDDGRIL